MIAVDTNVLVYAHREDSPWHVHAYDAVASLAEGSETWAIPAPCLHEFLAIVTHPRIYQAATPGELALAQVAAWLESPTLEVLTEGPGYWAVLHEVVAASRVVGPQVHDARIAALCMWHGASELWSADRDFSRFTSLRVTNPLVD